MVYGKLTNKQDIYDIAILAQGLGLSSRVEPNPKHKPPTVCFTLDGGQSAASGRNQKAKPEPEPDWAWQNSLSNKPMFD